MSQWIVTQGSNQFSVEGLDELEQLARAGRLSAGDMVQPPGTTEWMYVSEIEELAPFLTGGSTLDDDDLDYKRGGSQSTMVVIGVLVALIVVGAGAIFTFVQQLPRAGDRLLGEGGLAYSEMLVTQPGTGLHAEPMPSSTMVQGTSKDDVLELLAKRGDWYRARSKGGSEGWIPADKVIPMYMLGGDDVRDEFDPLYNPDRYVDVLNATWRQLVATNPRPGAELSDVTVFEFLMQNKSAYPMTDLVIEATIKDAKGHELQTVEIEVDGAIPAESHTTVGTLLGATDEEEGVFMTSASFQELAEDDPELQLRWSEGVEVAMGADEGVGAEINVVELRAVPDDEAAQVVRREE